MGSGGSSSQGKESAEPSTVHEIPLKKQTSGSDHVQFQNRAGDANSDLEQIEDVLRIWSTYITARPCYFYCVLSNVMIKSAAMRKVLDIGTPIEGGVLVEKDAIKLESYGKALRGFFDGLILGAAKCPEQFPFQTICEALGDRHVVLGGVVKFQPTFWEMYRVAMEDELRGPEHSIDEFASAPDEDVETWIRFVSSVIEHMKRAFERGLHDRNACDLKPRQLRRRKTLQAFQAANALDTLQNRSQSAELGRKTTKEVLDVVNVSDGEQDK